MSGTMVFCRVVSSCKNATALPRLLYTIIDKSNVNGTIYQDMQAIVIAPNREEGDYLSFVLRRAGWGVFVSIHWEQVLETLPERTFDLIVLFAPPMPEIRNIVNKFREVVQVPLIVLIESPTEDIQCELFDAGADFILPRPCSPRLLVRYARVLVRRSGGAPASMLTDLTIANIHLDPHTRQVTVDNQSQHLTQLEFRLLYILMNEAGYVIPIDDIVERVWGYSGEGNRDLVRGLVRRLRKKIEPSAQSSRYIFNIPGVGYRFAKN
jgi:DNA-binding response OmpR family regulator